MKKSVLLVISIIILELTLVFSSCQNQELNEDIENKILSVNVLGKYGQNHNDALDFLLTDKLNFPGVYSEERLDSVFMEYFKLQNQNDFDNISFSEISNFKVQVLNGNIPSLLKVRSGEFQGFLDLANTIALEALNECLNEISNYLNTVPEDEIFDNNSLLSDLHYIIYENYNKYSSLSKENIDLDAIELTLGVLYGSIEYWTNSNNVKLWAYGLNEENKAQINFDDLNSTRADSNKKEEKRKLSKAEYISVVGGADSIGALLGPEMAVIASAAAALYYDVE